MAGIQLSTFNFRQPNRKRTSSFRNRTKYQLTGNRSKEMNDKATLIAGLGAGALAMYLLDPEQGRSRRAFLLQKARRLARMGRDAADAASRDAQNRLIWMWKEAASRFAPEDVSDEALTARVRAGMGRKVSHPSAILVSCQDGSVTLSGDILAGEVKGLINCAMRVPGVKEVFDELNVHHEPGTNPNLQGEGKTVDRIVSVKPAHALAAGAIGLGLVAAGVARKVGAKRKESGALAGVL
jgi:osmotically-inducible protein OsmY